MAIKDVIIIIVLAITFILAIVGASYTPDIQTYTQYYGEMYNYSNASYTVSPANSGVFYNLTNMVGGNLLGFNFTDATQSLGGSYLSIINGGIYLCNLDMSGEGATAGGVYIISLGTNFIHNEDCTIHIEGVTAVDTIALSCILDLEAGDKLNILVKDEAEPTKDFKLYSSNLNCIKLVD